MNELPTGGRWMSGLFAFQNILFVVFTGPQVRSNGATGMWRSEAPLVWYLKDYTLYDGPLNATMTISYIG